MSERQGAAATSVPWAPDDDPAATPVGAVAEAEASVRVDAKLLESALLEARAPIDQLQLVFDCPGIESTRAERQQLLSQIDDYLLPRLRQSGAPILIAMVGSTGAGKSTLLNSVAGKQVSATGIRRPTTNSPVLACHPGDVGWFAENVFLPTLPRVRQQGLAMPGRDGLLVLATSEGMPAGVAMLDTPDIDSVVAAHRQFARQFLDASDLWLFVRTPRCGSCSRTPGTGVLRLGSCCPGCRRRPRLRSARTSMPCLRRTGSGRSGVSSSLRRRSPTHGCLPTCQSQSEPGWPIPRSRANAGSRF